MLLHRKEPFLREIVCDTSGVLCNFWRAVKNDPEGTAEWAEYPTIHQDLTARHKWLVEWSAENSDRLCDDPEYHDVKAAGWWVWGVSNWIGGGFCSNDVPNDQRPQLNPHTGDRGVQVQANSIPDKRPHVRDPHSGGRGVQVQRKGIGTKPIPDKRPHVKDPHSGGQGVQVQRKGIGTKPRPHVKAHPGGQGVQIQRQDTRPHVGAKRTGAQGVQVQRMAAPHDAEVQDKRPHVGHRKHGGVGVQVQRTTLNGKHPDMPIGNTGFLIDWFDALAHRLRKVVVFNRDWTSIISPTILGNTPTERSLTGIFLDPPYLTSDRANLYTSDYKGTSDEAAVESYKWAVENGNLYRIAYACHAGDFPVPDGWDAETLSFGGPNVQRKLDMVMFSPACVPKGKSERRNALIDALGG